MNFKSFFGIWDGQAKSRPALDLAIKLTRDVDGHLDLLCIAPTAPDAIYISEVSVDVVRQMTARAQEEAEALKAEAQAIVDAAGIAATLRAAALRYSEVAGVVGREGRFHDLIIMPRPFPVEAAAATEEALDGALFDTLAPVLVCPPKPVGELGRKIMVAWNGDQEAMRAIRAALPLLKAADEVEIVTVEPPVQHSGATPGLALMTMLTRHGVNAALTPIARTAERVSETLRQKARDLGADLIVMGAYGHSRFRERLLGGATREMLEDAESPVMMTH
ncbi:MAG: universal stress protein [Pseudomonadota bacterium]